MEARGLSDDRPTNKRIIDVGNYDGNIRGYVSDNNYVQIFAESDKNTPFPESAKFEITQKKEEKNRTEEKED